MKPTQFNPATGTSTDGFSRSSDKYATNQFTGHSNDGRLVNKGRGSTVGNDGSCHDPISGTKTLKGAPSQVRDTHALGAYGKAEYRGLGGTTVKKPGADAKINSGRGPTKGNQR